MIDKIVSKEEAKFVVGGISDADKEIICQNLRWKSDFEMGYYGSTGFRSLISLALASDGEEIDDILLNFLDDTNLEIAVQLIRKKRFVYFL